MFSLLRLEFHPILLEMYSSLLNVVNEDLCSCRPVSPLSDGGIGGSDGEGVHSPSRKKKRKYEEESSSKKDSFDQVFVGSMALISTSITCNYDDRNQLLSKVMKTCLKISLQTTRQVLITLMTLEDQCPRR